MQSQTPTMTQQEFEKQLKMLRLMTRIVDPKLNPNDVSITIGFNKQSSNVQYLQPRAKYSENIR